MIIQSLNDYYRKLKDNPNENVPLFGFSRENISFALILSPDGALIDVQDLRIRPQNRFIPLPMIVPDGGKKAAGIKPNFLWGATGYILGKDNKEHKDPSRPAKMFSAFKDFQHQLGDSLEDQGMTAILRFLDSWDVDLIELSPLWQYWQDMAGTNLVFRLDNDSVYIHESHVLQEKWLDYYNNNDESYQSYCLISGKKQPIARLHPSIKGVTGSQSSGASIVSFNLHAFCSYGKTKDDQSYNAPVSETITFNYTTALNHLLRKESTQKVMIGDTTVIFWAEGTTPVTGLLATILGAKAQDEIQNTNAVKKLRFFLEAIRDGKKPDLQDTENMKFFILGLAPNNARLSIRFWHQSTVEDVMNKVAMHFHDMALATNYDDETEPSVWRLLLETAPQRKPANIPPLLGGSLLRSILTGAMYPAMILTAMLNRIKADQSINYIRVAIIKAYLVRINRIRNPQQKEITMALDPEEKNVAYLLGRLFAWLEKAQKDAIPGANSTIKDRFFGSASATPGSVFPILLRRGQHHIEKLEFGSYIDKQIEGILADIQTFPRHLNIEDQGLFSIGYYHQKNMIYKKSDKQQQQED